MCLWERSQRCTLFLHFAYISIRNIWLFCLMKHTVIIMYYFILSILSSFSVGGESFDWCQWKTYVENVKLSHQWMKFYVLEPDMPHGIGFNPCQCYLSTKVLPEDFFLICYLLAMVLIILLSSILIDRKNTDCLSYQVDTYATSMSNKNFL